MTHTIYEQHTIFSIKQENTPTSDELGDIAEDAYECIMKITSLQGLEYELHINNSQGLFAQYTSSGQGQVLVHSLLSALEECEELFKKSQEELSLELKIHLLHDSSHNLH